MRRPLALLVILIVLAPSFTAIFTALIRSRGGGGAAPRAPLIKASLSIDINGRRVYEASDPVNAYWLAEVMSSLFAMNYEAYVGGASYALQADTLNGVASRFYNPAALYLFSMILRGGEASLLELLVALATYALGGLYVGARPGGYLVAGDSAAVGVVPLSAPSSPINISRIWRVPTSYNFYALLYYQGFIPGKGIWPLLFISGAEPLNTQSNGIELGTLGVNLTYFLGGVGLYLPSLVGPNKGFAPSVLIDPGLYYFQIAIGTATLGFYGFTGEGSPGPVIALLGTNLTSIYGVEGTVTSTVSYPVMDYLFKITSVDAFLNELTLRSAPRSGGGGGGVYLAGVYPNVLADDRLGYTPLLGMIYALDHGYLRPVKDFLLNPSSSQGVNLSYVYNNVWYSALFLNTTSIKLGYDSLNNVYTVIIDGSMTYNGSYSFITWAAALFNNIYFLLPEARPPIALSTLSTPIVINPGDRVHVRYVIRVYKDTPFTNNFYAYLIGYGMGVTPYLLYHGEQPPSWLYMRDLGGEPLIDPFEINATFVQRYGNVLAAPIPVWRPGSAYITVTTIGYALLSNNLPAIMLPYDLYRLPGDNVIANVTAVYPIIVANGSTRVILHLGLVRAVPGQAMKRLGAIEAIGLVARLAYYYHYPDGRVKASYHDFLVAVLPVNLKPPAIRAPTIIDWGVNLEMVPG